MILALVLAPIFPKANNFKVSIMIRINFLLFLRSFLKERLYTLINLGGLVLGMTGAFLLLYYVTNELNYNRMHQNIDRIYRVNTEVGAHAMTYGMSPFVLGTSLKRDLPEEVTVCRLFNLYMTGVVHNESLVPEENIYCADNEVFGIFGFSVLSGEAGKLLDDPADVVLSLSTAEKYFGDSYPVGKELILENNGDQFLLRVSGVFEDLPQNTTFRPHMLVHHDLGLQQMDKIVTTGSPEPLGAAFFETSWSMFILYSNYLMLSEGVDVKRVEDLLASYAESNFSEDSNNEFNLQPYADLYLGNSGIRDNLTHGNRKTVFIYLIVALLLLGTASVNYILLSSSRMQKREKEMALKRVTGSSWGRLVGSILFEAVVFCLLAMFLAIALSEILMPVIRQPLFGKELMINYLQNWNYTLLLLGGSLIIGILSGAYLALNMSRSNPNEILKSAKYSGKAAVRLSRLLNVVQLAIVMGLLISTGTIFYQIRYFKNSDTGFDIDHCLSIDVLDMEIRKHYDILKDRIERLPAVERVSGSMWAPPTRSNMNMTLSRLDDPTEEVNVQGLMVDYHFVETMGMSLLEGRDFSREMGAEEDKLIINKSAIEAIGIEGSPIGQQTDFGTIIGLVEDFHIHSFHSVVPPMILHLRPAGSRSLLVRFSSTNTEKLINDLQAVWQEIIPEKEMKTTFLTDALADLYAEEDRMLMILIFFSATTLFVALMGLFAMAKLNTERRTREVGIRKVMGAHSGEVVSRFVREYLSLILFSILFAVPLSWYLMSRWLQNFQYHDSLKPWIFISAILLTLLVVLSTVSGQVQKAANANPADSLRYE